MGSERTLFRLTRAQRDRQADRLVSGLPPLKEGFYTSPYLHPHLHYHQIRHHLHDRSPVYIVWSRLCNLVVTRLYNLVVTRLYNLVVTRLQSNSDERSVCLSGCPSVLWSFLMDRPPLRLGPLQEPCGGGRQGQRFWRAGVSAGHQPSAPQNRPV